MLYFFLFVYILVSVGFMAAYAEEKCFDVKTFFGSLLWPMILGYVKARGY